MKGEIPTHEEVRLPLEEELRERLEVRLRACEEGEVPFRTFHKLAALLAMRSGFAWICFEAAGRGSAGRIERWLREVILAQARNEHGQGVTIGSLDADPSIASAALIARKERASHIDQRHLLLALLADKNTGTMSEIARSLSATSRKSIQAAAETGRPRELHPVPHLRSAVPPVTREKK
jgi:ATP-dependent Clp protease ATP-binding subunit ClpA